MAIGNPITLTSNVASKTISVIATAGQTLFTVTGGYRINQLAVFRNGVRLLDSRDYEARNGATVALLSAATVGDALEFQVFDDFRVADAIVSAESEQTISGNLIVAGILTATNLTVTDLSLRHLKATGISTVSDTTQSTSTTTGAMIVSGGLGVAKNLFVGGSMSVAGTLTYEDVTNSETAGITTTGGLVVTGLGATFGSGVGIADSIYHIDDSNTAIRFPAADTFTVETGGSERVRVDSSGNLGINATALSGLLTLNKGNVTNAGKWSDSCIALHNPTNIGAYSQIGFGYAYSGSTPETYASAYMGFVSTNQSSKGYGDFVFGTRNVSTDSQPTERLRIDSSGFITQKFTSNNSTTAEGLFINNQQNTTGNNASLIFSNDSGNRKKAALALIDTGDYGSGDLVFALDGADSGELNLTNDEKLRITSAGIVTVSSGGSLAIPAVPGANTNADMPVLFQSTTGLIDGGSGLVYNPAEDSLKVNGNTINSQEFRGSGDDVKLTAANSSSTSFFQIDGGVPKISMASDKVIQFSASIGEIGNVTGFQATNTAASANTDFGIRATTIRFATGNSERCRVTDSGFMPDSNDARDLGSTSLRWANIFTADLQLSNETKKDTGGNDVDGTWGDYTIQEGENDLFLLNRRNGKKFKFMLQEVN